jgi:hypothetical protein
MTRVLSVSMPKELAVHRVALIAVLQATLHRRDLVILNEARDRFKLLANRRPAVRPGNKPMDVKREFGIEIADADTIPDL